MTQTPEPAGLVPLAYTAAVALAGAGLFHLIGFPAAPLTGPALAVSLAALAGVPVGIPGPLLKISQIALGLGIGASVTPEVIAGAARWPVSLVVMTLMLAVTMVVTSKVLQRGFGYNRATATLAATPGHLSYVIALASEVTADLPAVAVMQSIRVLFLTLCLPVVIAAGFEATGAEVLPELVLGPLSVGLLALAAVAVGFLFQRLRVPAAFLLAGIAVSAAAHLSEVAPGRMPTLLVTGALIAMGALIGTRFSGIGWPDLRRSALAGVVVTALAMLFAMAGAALVVAMLDLPAALLVIAFAPGGVEAMAAIAIQMGQDPTFVAAHHVWRLLLLTVATPVLIRAASAP